MKSPQVGLRTVSILFGVGAAIHLVRLATHFNIVIAGHPIPLWASGLGLVVAAGLSGWLWQLSRVAPHESAHGEPS